jgi:hypothetical protein
VLQPRNATEATGFNPVFKPLAPDPPRNLPPVIVAGTVVHPEHSFSSPDTLSAKPASVPGVVNSDSSHYAFNHGINTTTMRIIIGLFVIWAVLCVTCGTLLALRCIRWPGKGLATQLRKSDTQKPTPQKAASNAPTPEVGAVCAQVQASPGVMSL